MIICCASGSSHRPTKAAAISPMENSRVPLMMLKTSAASVSTANRRI